jgi:hypothetical protein
VSPLDFSAFLLWVGDVSYVAGLVLMAILSAVAGKKIEPRTQVPMQWGVKGKPTWFLRRRWALLFAPMLAGSCGFVLTALAHWDVGGLVSQQTVNLSMIRTGMALAFVATHMIHLSMALAWLGKR